MTDPSFDPYHRWLGIPPKHQPPDYYRLLALERFEDDEEVIRDAVERQIAHVRKYQLGQHAQAANKLLRELAEAKACLLGDEKRIAYDDQLRSQAAGKTPPPLIQPPEPPSVGPLESTAPPPIVDSGDEYGYPVASRPSSSTSDVSRAAGIGRTVPPAKRRRQFHLPMLLGVITVGLALIALTFAIGLSSVSDKPTRLTEPKQEPNSNGTGPRLPTNDSTVAAEPVVETNLKGNGQPPQLNLQPVSPQTIDELKELRLTVKVTPGDSALGETVFRLVQAPSGASISASTGLFRWTPNQSQGPGEYTVTVEASQVGNSKLRDQTSFRVQVNEVNPIPNLKPIADRSFRFRRDVRIAVANEPYQPAGTFGYRLDIGTSYGASVDTRTGEIKWSPVKQPAPGAYAFTVTASSNSTPSRSDSQSFTIRLTKDPLFEVLWLKTNEDVTWQAEHNLTKSELNERIELYRERGLRPLSINGYSSSEGETRFVAAWVADRSPFVVVLDSDRVLHQERFDEHSKNYRLIWQDFYQNGTKTVSAMVFVNAGRSFAWYSRSNNARDELEKWHANYTTAGQHPLSLSGHIGWSGGTYYSGLWVNGKETCRYGLDVTAEQYQEALDKRERDEWPSWVDAYYKDGQRLYSYILTKGSKRPAWHNCRQLSIKRFEEELIGRRAEGYYPAVINVR